MDYKQLYNLKEAPFNLTPDPDFFFPSKTHKIALETLLYSINSKEGFIQITGEPGTGKSMLLRKIIRQLGDSIVLCLLLHTNIKADSLLIAIMQDLKIDISNIENPNQENLITLFREFLLNQIEKGKHVIIIADEAQNMPDDTLEELRMLSNLETEKTKLLQIILVGQIELEHIITSTRLSQLYQRITIRYRLNPLTRKETEFYIFHRLKIASMEGKTHLVSFKNGVANQIFKWSKGVPRLINIISERALMASFITNSKQISKKHIKKGLVSIQGETQLSTANNGLITFCYICIFILIAAGLWGYGKLNPKFDLFSIKSPTAQIKTAGKPQITKPIKAQIFDQTRDQIPKLTPGQITKQMPESIPKKLSFDWIDLPKEGDEILIVNKATGMLSLWTKNNNSIIKTNEESFNTILPSGIYMAGIDNNNNRFIFNPEISYLMNTEEVGNRFWNVINTKDMNRVTPVLVLNSLQEIQKRTDIKKVRIAVNLWADAWQDLNIDDFIESFGHFVSIYETNEKQPVVFSKKKILEHKKDIFNKSKYVNLKISNTLCLLDPLDDNKAYAVFSQEYNSEIHQDNGKKILYFNKVFHKNGDFDWKITGKLWLKG
ncbi:MAG: AAA family ATPase [Desulfobacteraceae bacterium]|nr:AAA family ATPase [Desulfobacteraceae bacterium]